MIFESGLKLSPLCGKIYLIWIESDTWHTSHPRDKNRFYDFVRLYASYARKEISGDSIKRDILERYDGKFEPNHLNKKADYYATLFDELTEYISYTKRGR